jgi:hypothetical protein
MKETEKRRRAPRIAGIGAAAAALGVTRQHLHAVLAGKRQSRRLTNRYHALKQQG